MYETDVVLLSEKFLSNTITISELENLELLLKHASNLEIFKNIVKDDYLLINNGVNFNGLASFEKIKNRITPVKFRQKLKPYYKYAAIFVVALGIGTAVKSKIDTPIIEASNFIELELEDGSIKRIISSKTDTIRTKTQNVIGVVNNGSLVYKNTENNKYSGYNTLRIPYGKRFIVELSDGTFVHLNAGSSLKYPVSFIKNEKRIVSLSGEAFFNVAKNLDSPFIVKSEMQNIEVLGTQFNVSAYENDAQVTTTLIEGSIKLTEVMNPQNSIVLKSNEQVITTKNNIQFDKEIVNADRYTSWLEGSLVFKKDSFETIIKKLERKYAVTIENRNKKLVTEKFTAHFDTESIEQIMEYFKISYNLEYTIKGNVIKIE